MVTARPQAAEPAFVAAGNDGRLVYDVGPRGDRAPDYSYAGYMGGGVPIPDVPVKVRVPAVPGDATQRIQTVIEQISALPVNERGAVLLEAGRHEVSGRLRLAASGVTIRGEGAKNTVVVATGTDRRALVRVAGRADRAISQSTEVADGYVPVGATRFRVKSAEGIAVGSLITVLHPSTRAWVAALRMHEFGAKDSGWLAWRPGAMDVSWDRVVTAVEGDAITVDAPLTMGLDSSLAVSRVQTYSWPGRVEQVGVENLTLESAVDPANAKDEQHAWTAVELDHVRDAWVRNVSVRRFAFAAVQVGTGASRVTVEDVKSSDPVSENAAYRRHTFFVCGQQTLVHRCRAERGRHDFTVGHLAAGPNAFVECEAVDASGDSGPVESWATGVLYDNITMDGGGLSLTNREIAGQGVGWAAVNSLLWQCTAPVVTCRNPPTARNWAIGCWGQFVGDGHFRACNEFVKPESLYRAQLAERGNLTPRPPLRSGEGEKVNSPLSASERGAGGMRSTTTWAGKVRSTNGWLLQGDALLTGSRVENSWWRGSVVPGRAAEFGPAITRFAPGRTGPGATDDLDDLTDQLQSRGVAVFEHNYGLWYDRRRDDHQMVRRIDGAVWPPFFEQPFARSGVGTAWDGLSKYDLTRYNPWYFGRLRQFADLAGRKGIVLAHQMYFQHNVLEAGAHWADSPWRPANCLQPTGFPEPPPYANRKRVFMADAFYDVTHPVRRELHRAYIRHCLDELAAHPNVIHLTSAEYSGPLHFVQFWLDTVRDWRRETGKAVLIGLSCPKNVQDAVLADPERAAQVDVVDVRYWWYTGGGSLYAPKGGQNLAPRQHLREWKGDRSITPESVARSVSEVRRRFPDKVVICSLDRADGWAVLAAGGSVPRLPRATDAGFLRAVASMKPHEIKDNFAGLLALAAPGLGYVVYSPGGRPVRLDLRDDAAGYRSRAVDPRTGQPGPVQVVSGGREVEFAPPKPGPWLLWLERVP